jgi:hypothetical protein
MFGEERTILQVKSGSWPHLVIQGCEGITSPIERKVVPSKTLDHQRRNEQPCCHRVGHHLAFTKIGQEPLSGQMVMLIRGILKLPIWPPKDFLWALGGHRFLRHRAERQVHITEPEF